MYIEQLENLHQDPIQEDLYYICQNVQQSDSSCIQIYITINPPLRQHSLYLTINIPEYVQKAFTQVRPGKIMVKNRNWTMELNTQRKSSISL